MNVNTNYSAFFSITSIPDSEWQRIIEKLWKVYGIRSTGSKALDKQILHEKEKQDAEKESSISTKFLTLTKSELEKIQAKKKAKQTDKSAQNNTEITKGAEILGKQIFLAIQIKTEQDTADNKKKRDNKYYS